MSEQVIELPSPLEHESLMNEEGLTKKDLPKNIITRMTVLSMAVGRFKKNPNEENKRKAIAIDVEIADMIQNWIEEGIQEDEAEKAKAKEQEKADADAAAAAASAAASATKSNDNSKSADGKKEEVKVDPKGVEIDIELSVLMKNNKNTLTLDEIKKYAPVSYDVIFEHYEKGGENGVRTSKYLLKEVETEKFNLTTI